MRRRTRLAVPAAVAAAVATLAVAPAASATPDPDVVYVFVHSTDALGTTAGFGTAAKTDGSLAALPAEYTATEPLAIEIVGDLGYALVPEWAGADFTTTLKTWDTTTGEVLSSTTLALDAGSPLYSPDWITSFPEFIGLDSADGVHLQTVMCVWGATGPECYLGALDPADAAFSATVDVSAARAVTGHNPAEIATDPATGTTFLFSAVNDPQSFEPAPYAMAVHGGVAELPFAMTGIDATAGAGRPLGADFAPDGTLWLNYAGAAGQVLLSVAPGASLADAVPTVVGALVSPDPAGPVIAPDPFGQLAVTSWVPAAPGNDPAPSTPTLADTGVASAGPTALVVALLLAGVLLLAAGRLRAVRRRRTI